MSGALYGGVILFHTVNWRTNLLLLLGACCIKVSGITETETYQAHEIYDFTRFLKIDRGHMNASFPHWHRVEI